MTTKELAELAARNIKKNATIDTETGLAALEKIAKVAEKEEVRWALIGGIAMHVYGGPRQTRDVDVIAAKALSLRSERQLGFGGERYVSKVGKREVPVDWIVRKDEAKKFYEAALDESITLHGVPIITPEWLVILKYIAGRFKDQQDAVFLLKQKGLVNRRLIRKKLIETGSPEFYALIANNLRRWYDLADGKITTEKEDYEAERL